MNPLDHRSDLDVVVGNPNQSNQYGIEMSKEFFKLVISKLRVKIKSLACEQRIIKHEMRRFRKKSPHAAWAVGALESHSKGEIKHEIRATLWAYAYLRGQSFSRIEQPFSSDKTLRGFLVSRAVKILNKFLGFVGKKPSEDDLQAWVAGAESKFKREATGGVAQR